MTDIKQTVLLICTIAVAVGILRMIIPEGKTKTQLSFIISLVFTIAILSSVRAIDLSDIKLETENIAIPDMSGRLYAITEATAVKAGEDEIENYLHSLSIYPDEIKLKVNIDENYSISISDIELVFSKETKAETVQRAENEIRKRAGDEVIVTAYIRE